jgi:hypothetical protein
MLLEETLPYQPYCIRMPGYWPNNNRQAFTLMIIIDLDHTVLKRYLARPPIHSKCGFRSAFTAMPSSGMIHAQSTT